MKARNLTTIAATVAFALMIMFGSANRAEAHRGWGWGIGAGSPTFHRLGIATPYRGECARAALSLSLSAGCPQYSARRCS
jgi:hypothetical protein